MKKPEIKTTVENLKKFGLNEIINNYAAREKLVTPASLRTDLYDHSTVIDITDIYNMCGIQDAINAMSAATEGKLDVYRFISAVVRMFNDDFGINKDLYVEFCCNTIDSYANGESKYDVIEQINIVLDMLSDQLMNQSDFKHRVIRALYVALDTAYLFDPECENLWSVFSFIQQEIDEKAYYNIMENAFCSFI